MYRWIPWRWWKPLVRHGSNTIWIERSRFSVIPASSRQLGQRPTVPGTSAATISAKPGKRSSTTHRRSSSPKRPCFRRPCRPAVALQLGRGARSGDRRVQGHRRRDHREAVLRKGVTRPPRSGQAKHRMRPGRANPMKGMKGEHHEPKNCRLSRLSERHGCTLTIVGEEDEVIVAAAQHAAAVHGHEDDDELRSWLKANLKDEVPA